jgi:hypothetical protein
VKSPGPTLPGNSWTVKIHILLDTRAMARTATRYSEFDGPQLTESILDPDGGTIRSQILAP